MSYESDMNRARDIVRELSAIFDRYDEEIPPGPIPPAEQPKAITSLVIETEEDAVPITWGQVFKVGDVQHGDSLMARWPDGSTTQLQIDGKAKHADGSLRHAIISTIAVGGKLEIVKGAPKTELGGMKTMYTHSVSIVLDGITYTASVTGKDRWLDGPIATEYNGAVPFADKDGKQHPHLHLRTAIRCYAGEATRFDFTIENDWAYEPNPQNFTYDVSVEIGGKVVYQKEALTHYHHARWREIFWFGRDAPKVHIRHDPRYLIDTCALPNYDTSIEVLDAKAGSWSGPTTELMAVGAAMRAMPTTGGRGDIGLLPSWAASWLLSQGPNSAQITLGTADLAGSWSIHYRDKDTDKPISLIDYPYMTLLGNSGDTLNPDTKKREAFPAGVKGMANTPNNHDSSHQPNFAYLPYLLTGDLYYLEELQFWAMYNVFSSNPGYRQNRKGLVHRDQVRAQAWSLRTLAEAAYITPDNDRLKGHFTEILDANLAWYNAEYTDNPAANKLGLNTTNYAIIYNGKLGVGPWQDDFFTQSIGHIAELGYPEAKRLLKWKTRFVVERMIGKGACYVFAASYSLNVRSSVQGPLFDNIADVYRATIPAEQLALACGQQELAKVLKLSPGEMTGYSKIATGYPANMQPALAYAADVSEEGKRAWKLFMSRSVKPDYSTSPQFAIVPRTV